MHALFEKFSFKCSKMYKKYRNIILKLYKLLK
jgi:hypothetical protein